jgi:hypothetical protein
MNDQQVEKLYEMFRRKMHDVYIKNHKPDCFSDLMIPEYNAWQSYLRNALSMEVVDIEDGYKQGIVGLRGEPVGVRIQNPSNGSGFAREFIIVPLDFAEKALVLGELPDSL